jgi:SAM-dependent methyltransferase
MAYLVYNKNYAWLQHYQIAYFRKFIVSIRLFYFTKIKKNLKTHNSYNDGVDNNTIHHNLKGLIYTSGTRVLSLIHPLSAIDHFDRRSAKVLCIGPRTEGELFALLGLGFQKNNIKALDLISYSPWVDLGDMHEIPYENNSFDLIILGWVLAYSHNPKLAAENILKVAKDGAVIAISVEYASKELDEKYVEEFGYQAGHSVRMRTSDQILQWFEGNISNVYFRYDVPKKYADKASNIYVIFEVKK